MEHGTISVPGEHLAQTIRHHSQTQNSNVLPNTVTPEVRLWLPIHSRMNANEIAKLLVDMRILILGHARRRRKGLVVDSTSLGHKSILAHIIILENTMSAHVCSLEESGRVATALVLDLLSDLEVVESKELRPGTLEKIAKLEDHVRSEQ